MPQDTPITAMAAVAIVSAIKELTGKKAMIKWVNDIFIDSKKVCGILTEAITDFEDSYDRKAWLLVLVSMLKRMISRMT